MDDNDVNKEFVMDHCCHAPGAFWSGDWRLERIWMTNYAMANPKKNPPISIVSFEDTYAGRKSSHTSCFSTFILINPNADAIQMLEDR